MPETPDIRNYDIHIITRDNSEEVFDELEDKNIDPVLFGLTDESYETKSINDKKTINYIIQLKRIIKEQKDYYEDGLDK